MNAVSSRGTGWLRARLRRRAWPLVVTALTLGLQAVYSLWWAPVVRHHGYWVYPGDIWGEFRSAHFIGWGDLGGVYSASTALVTFPGMLLVLAPIAMLCGALGLTESFPYVLPHPTAWLVLGPYVIVVSCIALFACDALAERLGITRARRAWLCFAEGVVLWNVSVHWGHPEDALAMALALYAFVMAIDGRFTPAGWLLGAAVATQPLVLLMLPVMMAWAGRGRVRALVTRALLPSVALLVTPLAAEFHATAHALFSQPNYPNLDHVTPWTALAPVLGGSGTGRMVAAGPGRIVAIVLACLVGWRARRWQSRPDCLLLAAGCALSIRCLTESVMVAFYTWPVLALGLVLATLRGRWQARAAVLVAVAVTVCSDTHLGAWVWWPLVNGGLLVVLLLGTPSRVRVEVPITVETAEPVRAIGFDAFIDDGGTPTVARECSVVAG